MTNEIKDAGLVEGGSPAASVSVTLKFPFAIEDVRYEAVTIRRVTVKQMSDFIKSLKNGVDVPPPMVDLPIEAFNMLDDDDMMDIEEAMIPFTPRRLKAMLDSLPANGEGTQA